MRRIIFSIILIGSFNGAAMAADKVSPYLNGVNISYTDDVAQSSWLVAHSIATFKLVRFPGGLLADEYRWIGGVGLGLKDGQTGTKGFAEFCEGIGAEKMITVNFKTGTAAE